ncbi:MAG: hypothetical protein A2Y76_15680 [Planctomycetes bacterium RBG_13_60_9]|nr:MAG: hypothetical protein A2Y76_15680 [Planctomycetes bacterium RBG_13_60_9]
MSIERFDDRGRIEAFLRRDAELHAYSLGDLDDFFWPYVRCYGRQEDGKIRDVVLLYAGKGLPTLMAISRQPAIARRLLAQVAPRLPKLFYAHLSPGMEEGLDEGYAIESHGPHDKMSLRDPGAVRTVDCSRAFQLTAGDADELLRLYEESHPGNWFDLRLLQTGQYFGVRERGRLVSAAGVHVYSERYRVAALGNIVTHPACRNRGYATQATARLCQALLPKVEHIGLNVKADNARAIACYRKLGFEIVAPYGEFTIAART